MSFKDKTAVKGEVARQLGPRCIAIAHISGKWSDQILVQCPAKQANDSSLEGEGSFTRFSLPEQNSLFLLGIKGIHGPYRTHSLVTHMRGAMLPLQNDKECQHVQACCSTATSMAAQSCVTLTLSPQDPCS